VEDAVELKGGDIRTFKALNLADCCSACTKDKG